MLNKKKCVLLATSLLFTAISSANTPITLNSFTLWSGTYGDNTIRLQAVDPNIINPENCSDADSYMVSTSISQITQDRIFSVLMAASLSGRKVQVNLHGCERNRPAIDTAILLRAND